MKSSTSPSQNLAQRTLRHALSGIFVGSLLVAAGCPADGTPEPDPDAGDRLEEDAGVDRPDGGGEPDRPDANFVDAGNAPEVDAGGEPEVDAGNEPEPVDAGNPEPNEPDVNPNDEAGGIDNPLPVDLPFSTTVNLTPAGDYDCFSFTTEVGGILTAGTDGPNSCSGLDTRIRVYAAGATDVSDYLFDDDDDGPGPCSFLEEEIPDGTFLICARAFSTTASLLGVEVSATFEAYECGNGVIQPGEECDATPGCTANCLIDDGLRRENEAGGNNVANGSGVLDLVLDETVRGRVSGADQDWWRLPLPGGLNPGAVRFRIGGLDPAATSCGATTGLKGDIFTIDDFNTPAETSSAASPCQVATIGSIAGDVIFGNETLFIRVSTTSNGGSYTLTPTYIEQVCGNGELEPSEECEPNTPNDPLSEYCSPATCRYVPPANDSCQTAETLTIPDDGSVLSVLGVNTTASNRLSPSCRGTISASGGKDTFYSFTATQDGTVAVDLFTEGWAGGMVSVHQGACNALTELECDRTSPRPSVEVPVVTGETYIVSVDSTAQTGVYEVRLSYLIPPTNDICANAEDISTLLDLDGTAAILAGDTRAAADSSASDLTGCQVTDPGEGRDTHYTFVAAQSGRMQVIVDAPGWDAVAYVTEAGCGATTACGDGGDIVEAVVTQGERYNIVVDARDDEVGPYTLAVRYVPIPDNDVCADAEVVFLPSEGGTVSVSGDTTGGLDDLDADCSSTSASETRDTFYAFQAPTEGILDLDLDSTFDSVLVASFSCSFADQEICADGDTGSVLVPAGETVLVAVDAWTNSGFGTYTLNATFSPTPPNNLCTAPEVVNLPANGEVVVIEGSTVAASDDYTPTCSSSFATNTRDTFYSFVAPADGAIIMELDSTFDSVFAAAPSCDPDDAYFCQDFNEEGTIDVTAGEEVLAIVDAWSGGRGTYELRAAFAAAPDNDTCVNATELTFAPDVPVSVSGTNAAASDDGEATCGLSSASNTKDVWYRFTAQASGRVTAVADTSFGVDLAVRSGCGATTDIVCDDNTGGGNRQVSFDVVAGTDYYILIDGHTETQTGFFDLTLFYITQLQGSETCAGAPLLPGRSGILEGDLTGADGDYDAEELGDCTNFNTLGGDIVYAVTLEPGETLYAGYTAEESLNDEAIMLLDACPPVATSCVDGEDAGAPEELNYTHTGLTPKTFYIVIDEYGSFATSSGGVFTLTWEITGP